MATGLSELKAKLYGQAQDEDDAGELQGDTVGDLADADPAIDASGGSISKADVLAKSVPQQSDAIASTQGAPVPAPSDSSASASPSSKPDLSAMLISPQDLQDNQDYKRKMAIMGAIGNTIGNQQSFGNFFLGHMNPKDNSVEDMANSLSNISDQGIKNKQALLKQYQELPQINLQRDMMDPDSTVSKLHKGMTITAINELSNDPAIKNSPAAQDQVQQLSSLVSDPKSSAMDIKSAIESNPLAKDMFSNSIAGQKLLGTMAALGMRQSNNDRNYSLKVQTTGANQASQIDKDPIMTNLSQRQTQILIDKHTIESGGTINSSVAAELSNGLANAFGGGKGAGLTQSEKQEFSSVMGDLAKVNSYLSGVPQEQWTPEQRQFVAQTLGRAYAAFGVAAAARARLLAKSKSAAFTNPDIKNAVQSSADKYDPANDPNSQSQSSGPHGPTVVQNGHTFNWNPQTKQYE